MLGDMFDKRQDWWADDDHRTLGSQVDLESFVRGLPTGTQSQVGGHTNYAMNGNGSSQQLKDDEMRDVGDESLPLGEDESGTWNVAGNTSMRSESSSLPAEIVEFLSLLSQHGLDHAGGI